jgi:hypothetical protein
MDCLKNYSPKVFFVQFSPGADSVDFSWELLAAYGANDIRRELL